MILGENNEDSDKTAKTQADLGSLSPICCEGIFPMARLILWIPGSINA